MRDWVGSNQMRRKCAGRATDAKVRAGADNCAGSPTAPKARPRGNPDRAANRRRPMLGRAPSLPESEGQGKVGASAQS